MPLQDTDLTKKGFESKVNSIIDYYVKEGGYSTKNISDGYHTFDELYQMRLALTIGLFKQTLAYEKMAAHEFDSQQRGVWRSKLHHDDTIYDGMFIVGMTDLPKAVNTPVTACYISFHYDLIHWDKFDFCDTLEKAPKWDGHTDKEVIERLLNL